MQTRHEQCAFNKDDEESAHFYNLTRPPLARWNLNICCIPYLSEILFYFVTFVSEPWLSQLCISVEIGNIVLSMTRLHWYVGLSDSMLGANDNFFRKRPICGAVTLSNVKLFNLSSPFYIAYISIDRVDYRPSLYSLSLFMGLVYCGPSCPVSKGDWGARFF